jgi:hypothetical protein
VQIRAQVAREHVADAHWCSKLTVTSSCSYVGSMQSVSELSVLLAPDTCPEAQQQQPTCLEPAQHTMEELQLMAKPLKATLIELSEHGSCCLQGGCCTCASKVVRWADALAQTLRRPCKGMPCHHSVVLDELQLRIECAASCTGGLLSCSPDLFLHSTAQSHCGLYSTVSNFSLQTLEVKAEVYC